MKILKIALLLLVLSTVILVYSCSKESTQNITSDATIRFSGDNSCGFLLDTDSNGITYSPTNLAAEYKTGATVRVRVTFKVLTSIHQCGDVTGGGFKEVEVTQISRL